MPYYPLSKPAELPPNIRAVIDLAIEPLLEEFHHLLTLRSADQGPKGSFQRIQALVLGALADGAAQLFWPDSGLSISERFRTFLLRYYPWDRDEPAGFTRDEAVAYLWTHVRCASLHRFGLRHQPPKLHKTGNLFQASDESVELIERSEVRPFSDPFLVQNDARSVFWVEAFYWGLRQAIEGVLREEPARLADIEAWIAAGHYDKKMPR